MGGASGPARDPFKNTSRASLYIITVLCVWGVFAVSLLKTSAFVDPSSFCLRQVL